MVVANIQTRLLKSEAEKGSSRTVIGRGLFDSNAGINIVTKKAIAPRQTRVQFKVASSQKEKKVNIPSRMDFLVTERGHQLAARDGDYLPGKSYLFFAKNGRAF